MLRDFTLGEINESLEGKRIKICGWIETIRAHGGVIFFDLRDRYGEVQCVISKRNEDFDKAKEIKVESCVQIFGEVKLRPKGTENKDIPSGKVEISIDRLEILNSSEQLPFEINKPDVGEEIRLKYRFLDLRSKRMQKNLIMRSKATKIIRDFFYDNGFVEIETPILAKSTPEGARDYLVPSRNVWGGFYALPQSPQLFKQLTQIGGFDKYFQIAKCFRDEDLRSDRQPEFTQIDLEMSFIEKEDMMELIEKMLYKLFKELLGREIEIPFKRISYKDAMEKYGTDRPDLRKNKEDPEELAFCWIVDFPLFEFNDEENRYVSMHHPFTMPNLEEFQKDPKSATSLAYDVVLNGVEIGGGSIRVHNPELQKKIFEYLKIPEKEIKEKFGFLLDALSYGAPPHGGLAIGFDRLMQIILKETSIRECIAFPKNKEAKDVMLNAPSEVSKKQLEEIHIKVLDKNKEGKKTKSN